MIKLTKEQYIYKCNEIHNFKYDYNLVNYKNIRSKLDIICKIHGVFSQNAKKHKEGQGCPKCANDLNISKEEYIKKYSKDNYDYSLLDNTIKIKSKIVLIDKKTKIQYIQWAEHHKNGKKPTQMESKSLVEWLKIVHENKYDYIIEKDIYYATDKIKIVDNYTNDIHKYRIDRHLNGMKPNRITINYFLLKAKKIHNNKYDYSLINTINRNTDKVNIICKKHGVFIQKVSNHINIGDGCPKCVGVGKWNNELLITEFKKVHKNNFDYTKVEFKNIDKKVEIVCKIHGSFYQNIYKHLLGQGCKLCEYKSKGEEYIKMWLDNLGILYIRQHSFESCRYKKQLYFDFYLPNNNMCIEFDGEQHYKPIDRFGGVDTFNLYKIRDSIKNNWCLANNINLLRIKYNDINKIKYILDSELQISR
jgi:very-short-patch-repair endonuclease